jgi:hypothetical protein
VAGPFVYNIIAYKSGKRAFDVKISDGNIVRIIFYIYDPYIRFTQRFSLYTTPGVHISLLHTTPQTYAYRCIYHSHTHTHKHTGEDLKCV